jgi:hypothetical protein
MVVSADAAVHIEVRLCGATVTDFRVWGLPVGVSLTSKARETAQESIAAYWSCKQIEPRVKSLVDSSLILATHHP